MSGRRASRSRFRIASSALNSLSLSATRARVLSRAAARDSTLARAAESAASWASVRSRLANSSFSRRSASADSKAISCSMAAACSGVFTESSWVRKRTVFCRWEAMSRSRRVRRDSSRVRASEVSAESCSAAVRAVVARAISEGSARMARVRRVRSRSTLCSFTRFSIWACIRVMKSTAFGIQLETTGLRSGISGQRFAIAEQGRRQRKWETGQPAKMRSSRETAMVVGRETFWRRNRWIMWVGGGILIALAALAVAAAVLARRAEPYLRARIVQGLQERFHAQVELDSFHMSVRNGLDGHWGVWAEGKGLRIWPPAQGPGVATPATAVTTAAGEVGDKPLIQLQEFRFHAPLIYERGQPFHISVVEVKGLDVDQPPRSYFEHASAGTRGGITTASLLQFDVDGLDCSDARLVLETSKPGKLPMEAV